LFFIDQQGLGHFSGIGPYFPLAEGLWVQILLKRRRKTTSTEPTTLGATQAGQSTFTTLVISGNNKNKQLSLLSQCKRALTSRNTLFALLNHRSTQET
jgi:hypothetical protein